uniref:Uncharacterized protein n=1 Tax=Lactuca sativa TaxID=4236 RepID=A0A9R1UDE9_LACSA|nr:hypothetical protein LSAT_V11C900495500 [Lactuca sativa]
MTPTEIWELIEKLVVELKHSGNKDEVNEFSSHHLEAQIYELKKAILLPTKEKGVVFTTKVCGICMTNGHPTDMCKLLQELIVTVKVVAGYQKRNFYQKNNKGWNVKIAIAVSPWISATVKFSASTKLTELAEFFESEFISVI